MKNFEDPIQFDIKKTIGSIQIAYTDLMEICQGGPEIGTILIDGKKVEGRFGGPLLYNDNFIYIPIYIKKFFSNGFKIARINVATLNIETFGTKKNLIFLDKISENKIYYYDNLYKTNYLSLEL